MFPYVFFVQKSNLLCLIDAYYSQFPPGGTLYANIGVADLAARIKTGARPDQPPFIYDDIYQLMLNCWQLEPSDRLTFPDLVFALRQLLTAPEHVLSYDRRDGIQMPFYLPLMEVEQNQ